MPEAIERVPLDALKPYPRNTRTHSKGQIEQIARSIERFGFTNPVLVDDELTIIAGHGRVEAAKRVGLGDVPIIRLSRMSAADIRAYRIADNRLAELGGWDNELLAIELQGLTELGFDVELTGFAVGHTAAGARAVPTLPRADDPRRTVYPIGAAGEKRRSIDLGLSSLRSVSPIHTEDKAQCFEAGMKDSTAPGNDYRGG